MAQGISSKRARRCLDGRGLSVEEPLDGGMLSSGSLVTSGDGEESDCGDGDGSDNRSDVDGDHNDDADDGVSPVTFAHGDHTLVLAERVC